MILFLSQNPFAARLCRPETQPARANQRARPSSNRFCGKHPAADIANPADCGQPETGNRQQNVRRLRVTVI
jgi:hypothetical protein